MIRIYIMGLRNVNNPILLTIILVVGVLIALGQSAVYVYSGQFGDLSQVGAANALLIIMQLTFSGLLIILMDEMMSKVRELFQGYGQGSAISLFIATNVCESIVWSSFSPISVKISGKTEYEGSVISLFHSLLTQEDKLSALQQAFYRSHLPNLNQIIATILIFLIVIYFQGFRVDLPFKHSRIRGNSAPYSIKLFYTSNMPIIL